MLMLKFVWHGFRLYKTCQRCFAWPQEASQEICLIVALTQDLHLGHSQFAMLQNIVGLVPLALILGEITEDLAVRFGPTVGGLLNATFGNVVELILSIVALTKGLYTVVAASLIGSILSNLLLVLGKPVYTSNVSY